MTHARISPAREFIAWLDLGPGAVYDTTLVLPAVADPFPVHDSATQRIVESAPIVEATQVRRTWLVLNRNPAALDRIARIESAKSDLTTALANWDTLTNAQLKAATKIVVQFTKLMLDEERVQFLLSED